MTTTHGEAPAAPSHTHNFVVSVKIIVSVVVGGVRKMIRIIIREEIITMICRSY
jgi:hypothetical protein